MAKSQAVAVRYVDDDSWRREICPDCGVRLLGLAAWREHGPRHGWGSGWFAARIRAAVPGEIVQFSPAELHDAAVLEIQAVEDTAWKRGIEA